jgi:predicted regulator of Ras-like GTPase activity (Roadblock/LC7/MglB family)
MQEIPTQLRGNDLSKILDGIRKRYHTLSRDGRLDGLVIADQDAKVLAVNSFFDQQLNYWDVGAIGAALYGISRQGRDFFRAEKLERASLIYGNVQFFVHRIGAVDLPDGKQRELIAILLGNGKLNIGLVIMFMRKYVKQILEQVEQSEESKQNMLMSESEFQKHLVTLKKELFNLAP